VERDLSRLDKKEARRILDKIEKDLSARAETYPVLKGEFAGLRKMRVGDYRIIFTLMDKDILILRIGHKREIYKKSQQ
jgi:mRNA interferase RelE/StbE